MTRSSARYWIKGVLGLTGSIRKTERIGHSPAVSTFVELGRHWLYEPLAKGYASFSFIRDRALEGRE